MTAREFLASLAVATLAVTHVATAESTALRYPHEEHRPESTKLEYGGGWGGGWGGWNKPWKRHLEEVPEADTDISARQENDHHEYGGGWGGGRGGWNKPWKRHLQLAELEGQHHEQTATTQQKHQQDMPPYEHWHQGWKGYGWKGYGWKRPGWKRYWW